MAAVFGDKYTDAFTDGDRVSPAHAGGVVHCLTDTYTAAALASASTITVGAAKIPKGARILYAELRFAALGANTSLKLDVGTVAVIATAVTTSAGAAYVARGIQDTAVDADSFAIVTNPGAGAATGEIEVVILYTFH